MAERHTLRVGIDVGGTFTDLAALESWSGKIVTHKIASTPGEPQRAVMEALKSLLDRYESPPSIELLAHSTTIATNALLGQMGLELPRVALVTTRGFRDVIEIGRQNRSEVYNLFVERPRPLVSREDRLTVSERLDHCGNVITPLDESSVAEVCDQLRQRNVAAVAICLLHSYANDAHERRVAEALAAALPHARITRSSEVDSQYREYERCSTTVVNAALAPIVESYLEQLVLELRANGVETPLYVMRSDGGMAAARAILSQPAAIVESGPASGVVATAELGRRTSARRLLSFDMGGTTAKAGAVVDGIVQVASEFEAAGKSHSGRAVKGSGYPVRFPFVDLAEVSAGGGTIAWLDDARSLRVGPLSAGADPGPACYGKSDRATVTDANVVLGRLNQRHLLGGAFPIDASRARSAVACLGRAIDTSPEATAAGIIALIDDAMAKVLRIVTVERGLDPRDFTLVAFGGGGPLHACALADELSVTRVLIPPNPGLFSACGLLNAELRVNDLRAILRPIGEIDPESTENAFAQSEADARAELIAQGAHPASISFRRQYDARYRGQSFELTIDHADSTAVIAQCFHDAHRARFGYDAPEEVVELVNARLTAHGKVPSPPNPERYDATPRTLGTTRGSEASPRIAQDDAGSTRAVWIDGAFVEVPIFGRSTLRTGTRVDGPAIIEEYDSTTYLAPTWSLTVEDGLLALQKAEPAT